MSASHSTTQRGDGVSTPATNSSNNRPNARGYIPTLDGWRAVAISLVVIAHAFEDKLPIVAKLGALGVDLFFALSGYLICTLLLSELVKTGRISLSSFYKRRVFRIVRAALTYLLFIAVLGATGVVALRRGELLAAFYAANYFHARSWFTAHYWSLSMEEHFYLFWPAILALARPRNAQVIAVAMLAGLVLYRPWAEAHFATSVYQRTDMRLDVFLLPCLLAILLKQPIWHTRLATLLRPWVCVLLLAAVCGMAALAARQPAYGNAQKLLQSAILPLLIVSTVLRPSVLSGLLELSAVRWIGRISYSLYLWQQLFCSMRVPGLPCSCDCCSLSHPRPSVFISLSGQ
jgi:peptidoglycan/LPS O-acetylase OafA/YrhL